MPQGACIVACKHQSVWETFALFVILDDPIYILKAELMWLPLFGWLARKARIDSDRPQRPRRRAGADDGAGAHRGGAGAPDRDFSGGDAAAARRRAALHVRRRLSLQRDRRSLAFRSRSIPDCSGRGGRMLRFPGTMLVEVLDPIAPGLDRAAFTARLKDVLEDATARLVAEGRRQYLVPAKSDS